MDTRNGVTRQLLSGDTGVGNHPQALSGGMAQEANAWGNTQDTGECQRHSLKPTEGWPLTWVGCQGR
jgi:hypothetical protein